MTLQPMGSYPGKGAPQLANQGMEKPGAGGRGDEMGKTL